MEWWAFLLSRADRGRGEQLGREKRAALCAAQEGAESVRRRAQGEAGRAQRQPKPTDPGWY